MKVQQRTKKQEVYQLLIVAALIGILTISGMVLVEKTGKKLVGKVIGISGTNATMQIFDDGDRDRSVSTIRPGFEVNNLFNDTSNVYFYANYTNGTGQSVVNSSGTICAIEFAANAGGNAGPFSMSENTSITLFEYNRSFPRNGTFSWNVTCSNAALGTASLIGYDSVRIFGPGCTHIPDSDGFRITNNTILCGGQYNLTPAAIASIELKNINITLDCNASRIMTNNTADTHGAINGTANGSIIKNCIFENFDTGIIGGAPTSLNTLLLFNNTFINMSVTGLNITRIQDVTVRQNNITASAAGRAITALDVTTINISQNNFANNLSTPILSFTNVTTNVTDNNTLEMRLVLPANNTDHIDINFTFTQPSLSLDRACVLTVNSILSGRRTITSETENNLTLNRSLIIGDRYSWFVNCTDAANNGGVSVTFNNTYRACTVPAVGFGTGPANITLCPGRYELNTTEIGIEINGTAGGIICNNTQIIGNNNGLAFNFTGGATDGQLRHCTVANFMNGVNSSALVLHRLMVVNNTFTNVSDIGVTIKSVNSSNITNNSFTAMEKGIFLFQTKNSSVDNNFFYNDTNAIHLGNSTNSSVRNNNISNITGVGLQIDPFFPVENRTDFINYTVSGNYFCGINGTAIKILDHVISSTLNGMIAANTFCNTTDANPNGAIGKVFWTTDIEAQTTAGAVAGSLIKVRDSATILQVNNLTNATGAIQVQIEEFNISANNNFTYLTPHTIIGNLSTSTKTVLRPINESRVFDLGNKILLNLSNPDAVPAPERARRAAAARAAAAAAAVTVAPAEEAEKEEEEEKEEIIIPQINYTYSILIKEVYLNKQQLYKEGTIIDTPVFKDYESYVLVFTLQNDGTGNLSDMIYSLQVPESLNVLLLSADKQLAQENESVTVTYTVESGDIADVFEIVFSARSESRPEARASITVQTILEAGKGSLYYTRAKIIEETQAVVVRTYKILFLLLLIPLVLLIRITTIADGKAVRRIIEDKRLSEFSTVYVPEEVYAKYNMFENLRLISLSEQEQRKANEFAKKKNVSYEHAVLLVFANKRLIPRILTIEEVPKEVRRAYPRILFTSPLRNYREDQLKRYVETEQRKGFSNNEIRSSLLAARWKPEVLKKYLNPEEEIKEYVEAQKKAGRSLAEIRQQLLAVKWDKAVVDTWLPKEDVVKEYIQSQRRKGVPNTVIRKELLNVGWGRELVNKQLNPENDLKAYIVFEEQKGTAPEEIKKQLLAAGWKKEIVARYFAEKENVL